MGPGTLHIWGYRAAFLALAFAVILLRILPLGDGGGAWVMPDLLLALTLAWLLRQPDIVPIASIVIVFLLADFLLQRPPGLWTALMLLVTESLRARRASMTEYNFVIEWAWVAGTIFTLILLDRVALWLLMAPQTSLGLALIQGVTTVAVYPLVVLISHYVLGLRKLSPAEAEAS